MVVRRYCVSHSNIKFISLSQRVMSFLWFRQKPQKWIERTDLYVILYVNSWAWRLEFLNISPLIYFAYFSYIQEMTFSSYIQQYWYIGFFVVRLWRLYKEGAVSFMAMNLHPDRAAHITLSARFYRFAVDEYLFTPDGSITSRFVTN